MDHQQLQSVNRAAEEWTDSVRQSFQVLADRTVALQESNLKLAQGYFQGFLEQLQSQTRGNEEVTRTLRQQGERQQQSLQTLARESANAYSDFLNSALSFYQQTLQMATQVAQSGLQASGQVAQRSTEVANQAVQSNVQAANQFGQGSVRAARRASNS